MKRILSVTLLFFAASFLTAQTIADFENFELEVGEFINQDVNGTGFNTGAVSLPNNFNENYQSWDGWAVSATNDVTTPGFVNQYSSIVGAGFDGSTSYGVAFSFGENIIRLTDENGAAPGTVNGMYITNSTYAFLSMLEGDMIAKKFGGETGEDPDFFSVVFRGYQNGVLSTDSIEFFLGDYRADNSADDFLVDEWTWLDLSGFGEIDSLSFSMRSSDVGEFGINTPVYFCVDDITVNRATTTSSTSIIPLELDVYPTLTHENLTIDLNSGEEAVARLVSLDGQQAFVQSFIGGKKTFDLKSLPSGFYVLQVEQEGKVNTRKIIIQ